MSYSSLSHSPLHPHPLSLEEEWVLFTNISTVYKENITPKGNLYKVTFEPIFE